MTSKLGRNDRCHCGSGRKYKKCHLAADEAAAAPPTTEDPADVAAVLARLRNPGSHRAVLERALRVTDRRDDDTARLEDACTTLFRSGPLRHVRFERQAFAEAFAREWPRLDPAPVRRRLPHAWRACQALWTPEFHARALQQVVALLDAGRLPRPEHEAALVGLFDLCHAGADEPPGLSTGERVFMAQMEEEVAAAQQSARDALAAGLPEPARDTVFHVVLHEIGEEERELTVARAIFRALKETPLPPVMSWDERRATTQRLIATIGRAAPVDGGSI